MPFTLYDQQDIQTILAASHITPLQSRLNKDNTNAFDLYFRPKPPGSQSHNFIVDLIEYLLVAGAEAGNRRIAFLDNNFTLIVECSGFNFESAKRIQRYISKEQFKTVDSVIAAAKLHASLRYDLHHLYTHIRAMFVTTKLSGSLVSKISLALSKAYSLCHPLIPDVDLIEEGVGVTFMDRVLGHLQQGNAIQVHNPSVEALYHRHVLIHWIKQLHQLEPSIGVSITTSLEIILKFHRLNGERKALESQYKTAAEANTLLLNDWQNKKIIFSYSFSALEADLRHLPLPFLIQILTRRKTPQAVLPILIDYQLALQSQLIAWETSWQQRAQEYQQPWSEWLIKKAKQTVNYLYDNSFMPLGAHFFTWIADHVKAYFPWQPSLIKKLAMILGNLLGAVTSSYLGLYYLLRITLINSGTQWLREYLKSERIDLETASLSSNDEKIPSLTLLLRMNHFFITLISASSAKDPRFVLDVLSSLAGSLAFEGLGDFVLHEFSEDMPLTPEDKCYLRLIISLTGMEAGHLIANTYCHIADKLAAREAAIEHLNQLGQQDATVFAVRAEASDSNYSPSFWFSDKNEVTVYWKTQTESGEFHSKCHVSSDKLSHIGTIDCEKPIHNLESRQQAILG